MSDLGIAMTSAKKCPFCGSQPKLMQCGAGGTIFGCPNKDCKVRPLTDAKLSESTRDALQNWDARTYQVGLHPLEYGAGVRDVATSLDGVPELLHAAGNRMRRLEAVLAASVKLINTLHVQINFNKSSTYRVDPTTFFELEQAIRAADEGAP